jgi:hypothetical protein
MKTGNAVFPQITQISQIGNSEQIMAVIRRDSRSAAAARVVGG